MAFLQCPLRRPCLSHNPTSLISTATKTQSPILHFLLPSTTTIISRPTKPSSTSTRHFSSTPINSKRTPSGSKRTGPRSTYQVRFPRYYRGPLHPHQPPHPSDPHSRLFVPGPFTSERLWDHYQDTIRPDLLALSYTHLPPGFQHKKHYNRLRQWEGDSPYFAGRPLRGPRGGSELALVDRPMTFRNVPQLQAIVVNSFVNLATKERAALTVAGIALMQMTGVRATVVHARTTEGAWGLSKGKPIGVKVRLEGPAMYRFLSSCIEVVMPKIKEFQGVKTTTGDDAGNLSFGFTPDAVAMFPEIEVNYDMFPPKFIPGCNVTCITSATNDKDAKMLLGSFGVPFYVPKRKQVSKKTALWHKHTGK